MFIRIVVLLAVIICWIFVFFKLDLGLEFMLLVGFINLLVVLLLVSIIFFHKESKRERLEAETWLKGNYQRVFSSKGSRQDLDDIYGNYFGNVPHDKFYSSRRIGLTNALTGLVADGKLKLGFLENEVAWGLKL